MADEARVLVGVVVAAHGIRGDVRIQSYCEEPADIAAYGPVSDQTGKRGWTIGVSGVVRGNLVARLDGVTDRNAADALRGVRLYVPKSALPATADGEWYHADLIGLAARGVDGTDYGKVLAVEDFGGGTLLELSRGPDGKPFLMPFTEAAVPVVDVAGGAVTVDPPEGLLGAATPRDGADGENDTARSTRKGSLRRGPRER